MSNNKDWLDHVEDPSAEFDCFFCLSLSGMSGAGQTNPVTMIMILMVLMVTMALLITPPQLNNKDGFRL